MNDAVKGKASVQEEDEITENEGIFWNGRLLPFAVILLSLSVILVVIFMLANN